MAMRTRLLTLSILLLNQQNSIASEQRTKGSASESVLVPGSLLQLSSSEDKSLNSALEIDWNGDTILPLCGKIRLSGLSLHQAERTIDSCLERFFKKPPDFEIAEILPRLGAVKVGLRGEKSSTVRIQSGASVHSLIATTGLAVPNDYTLRLLSPYGLDIVLPATSAHWNEPFQWKGGETVIAEKTILEKNNYTIDILGEVRKPGKLDYRPSQSILSILREAQGPTTLAAQDSAHIFRGATGQKIETTWDDQVTKIEPGDAIMIPAQREGGFERGLRWTSSVLAVINTLFLIMLARKG